ncbi:hypothetical protein D5F01_LYC24571 [Larimichthys crocea]|uniref:WD repeat-containing protein 93 n=1 Tax=Larimichthys crocea TaxID=215358 RepID=A0A6G0HEM4_LARCR|nr:hypothetical protein D5F01_LYC24571 [Larimichthys crocea]
MTTVKHLVHAKDSNSSEDVGVKWSPVALLIKIKPPKIPADVVPTIFFHLVVSFLVTANQSLSQDCLLSSVYGGVAAIIFFSICCKEHQRKKADVEPMPDMLWPHAKEILCSAVSRCTRYIALGLVDGVVCVWDRQSGSPLSVVLVSAVDSAFSRMQFVDFSPVSANDFQTFTTAKVRLLVSLVVQRNGNMLLQDVIKQTTVCFLIPPTTHLIATPCNPVYALNTKQQTLFIKAGDLDTSCTVSSEEGSQSQLFMFSFGESDIFKQYISLPDTPQQLQTLSCATLEETCDVSLQQRALSVDERNKARAETWKQLQETAVMVQQRAERYKRAAVN